ncbi:DUF1183 domain protein [Aspergillus affinis]|uniref:DUF1183 domain protein n=1 Tax=Aspergillus affinis TaxID=1070780 RepID=UPI0022FE0A39|nr:uncharacterized protein KD926_002491 [Aspergillus affinis]KAI9036064.1 hypothetical protein KD926_002491 [Aspergillus affinis]
MHHPTIPQLLLAFLLPASVLSYGGASSQTPPGNKAILLSKVQTLTLRGDRLTSSRRVSPTPQLQCVGPSKRICQSYPIDVMRCTNAGHDYDEEDVQWTCTASLPPELKLGSTDVICEGYRNADDPWVLKGSCGVEYRLLLTDLGEKEFGRQHDDNLSQGIARNKWQRLLALVGDLIFFGFIVAVIEDVVRLAVAGVVGLVVMVAVEAEAEGEDARIMTLRRHIVLILIALVDGDLVFGPARWEVLRLVTMSAVGEAVTTLLHLRAGNRPHQGNETDHMTRGKAARGLRFDIPIPQAQVLVLDQPGADRNLNPDNVLATYI